MTLVIPPETLLSVKRQALEEGSTVCAVILKALDEAGHGVPPHDFTDRLRKPWGLKKGLVSSFIRA